jgi:hypothetical protein
MPLLGRSRCTRPKQAAKAGGANPLMGIDGDRGVLADMSALQVWDTFAVKVQTIKTAIEVCGCPFPVVVSGSPPWVFLCVDVLECFAVRDVVAAHR